MTMDIAKKYTVKLYELLRSETSEKAFLTLRELQSIEEDADRDGYTILIKADIVKRGAT